MKEIPNSGYLELFYEGKWKAVDKHDWDWKKTKVACRKLGFKYDFL